MNEPRLEDPMADLDEAPRPPIQRNTNFMQQATEEITAAQATAVAEDTSRAEAAEIPKTLSVTNSEQDTQPILPAETTAPVAEQVHESAPAASEGGEPVAVTAENKPKNRKERKASIKAERAAKSVESTEKTTESTPSAEDAGAAPADESTQKDIPVKIINQDRFKQIDDLTEEQFVAKNGTQGRRSIGFFKYRIKHEKDITLDQIPANYHFALGLTEDATTAAKPSGKAKSAKAAKAVKEPKAAKEPKPAKEKKAAKAAKAKKVAVKAAAEPAEPKRRGRPPKGTAPTPVAKPKKVKVVKAPKVTKVANATRAKKSVVPADSKLEKAFGIIRDLIEAKPAAPAASGAKITKVDAKILAKYHGLSAANKRIVDAVFNTVK